MGSHPHGTRLAVRLADLAPKRKSQSQPYDAHNATRVLCLVLSDTRRRDLGCSEGVAGRIPSRRDNRDRESSTGHDSDADGGLGLRSAVRCGSSGVLGILVSERTPEVADEVVRRLGQEGPVEGCLGELQAAATELDQKGFWCRLALSCTRADVPHRVRPVNPANGHTVGSVGLLPFRKNLMLTNRTASRQAHLRSHSGRNAGVVFSHAPTTVEFTVPPHLFRVLLPERLQLPLPLMEATCNGCHEPLDPLGRHPACTCTGRIKKRSSPTERVLARVCREAGALVKFNAFLRDMNLGIRGDDERRIEVLAQDLPCFKGAQLAGVLSAPTGEAQPGAAEEDGAVLAQARRDKEATYPELLTSRRRALE